MTQPVQEPLPFFDVIGAAIKAVPAVKYALGVAGIGAAAALIGGLIDFRVAAFGIPIIFGLMFVLVVFARQAGSKGLPAKTQNMFLSAAWAFIVLTITVPLLLVTCTFFDWPKPIYELLGRSIASPSMPGETGWIFAGYLHKDTNKFSEGPYVDITKKSPGDRDAPFQVGDIVRLAKDRRVIVVGYKTSGERKKLNSPIQLGVISANDETGIVLPAYSNVLVRDVSLGAFPNSRLIAVWLRVVKQP